MIISKGIQKCDHVNVTSLYWEAFGAKLGKVMGPETKALAFIRAVLDGSHAICAHDDMGNLLGVAGFKTHESALVGGTFHDLIQVYGLVGATWRAGLLNLLERDTEDDCFLMDGIFVTTQARGKGVGTALLQAIIQEAQARGYDQIRLDVVDTNPRAQSLYERSKFVATHTHYLGPLQLLFGFRSATTMVYTV